MPSSKEIRTQIGSIKKTQKITRAMEMVSASKVRRAQDRMALTRPYAKQILEVISHLGEAHPEYTPKYLDVRDPKRIGYIIISTDRGLCGALNHGLFRKIILDMKKWHDKNIEIDICAVGTKGAHFFKRLGANMVANAGHLGDKPSVKDIIGVVKVMLDRYQNHEIDALYIGYNDFVNTMQQNATIEQLLPIVPSEDKLSQHHWDYIYEPDAKQLIDFLLQRYIESQVYQAMVENIASEHAARMVAMKNATENAGDLIANLQLAYNKARQASITKELAEIVAGAEAV